MRIRYTYPDALDWERPWDSLPSRRPARPAPPPARAAWPPVRRAPVPAARPVPVARPADWGTAGLDTPHWEDAPDCWGDALDWERPSDSVPAWRPPRPAARPVPVARPAVRRPARPAPPPVRAAWPPVRRAPVPAARPVPVARPADWGTAGLDTPHWEDAPDCWDDALDWERPSDSVPAWRPPRPAARPGAITRRHPKAPAWLVAVAVFGVANGLLFVPNPSADEIAAPANNLAAVSLLNAFTESKMKCNSRDIRPVNRLRRWK